MIRLSRACFLICLVVPALLTAGCSKPTNASSPSTSAAAAAFASAASETKAKWDKATAAAATNDYATAILTLRELVAQADLTPEQRADVNQAWKAANDQMLAAAQKGDPQAKAALEDLRMKWRQR